MPGEKGRPPSANTRSREPSTVLIVPLYKVRKEKADICHSGLPGVKRQRKLGKDRGQSIITRTPQGEGESGGAMVTSYRKVAYGTEEGSERTSREKS